MELSCDHTCPLSEQTHLSILSFLLTLHHLTSEGTQAQRRSPAPLCKCLYVEWDKSQSMDSSVKKIEFCPETGLTSTLNLFCPWKGRNLSLGQMASPPLCVCLGGGFHRPRDCDGLVLRLLSPLDGVRGGGPQSMQVIGTCPLPPDPSPEDLLCFDSGGDTPCNLGL